MFKKEEFLNTFKQKGWPSIKDERWKYTSLKELSAEKFDGPNNTSSFNFNSYLEGLNFLKSYLVFIDGRLNINLSRQPQDGGVYFSSINELINNNDTEILKKITRFNNQRTLNYLNAGQLTDGVLIKINSQVKEPIGLIFITTQKNIQSHIRNLIEVEAQAKVKILECYKGFDQTYFNNILTSVYLNNESSLELYKIQEESTRSYHISSLEVFQEANSHFESHLHTFGGKLTRNEIAVSFNASGSRAELFGLYAASGTQHVDNTTFIDHAVSDCQSEELYKGILDAKAHGVFSGEVLVRENAQKTDARQKNKNLLLSEEAHIDTKPQLKIYADDVKCAHGATIGQLDKAAVFYLRSRGIDEAQANIILTRAFAVEMLEKIKDEKMKEYFDKTLQNWFNHQTLH